MREQIRSKGPASRAAPSFLVPAGFVAIALVVGWGWMGSVRAPQADGSSGSARPATKSAADTPERKPAADGTLTLVTAKGRFDISLEIADTPEKQAVGLMFRRSLPVDHGMLFPHPSERELTMWMRNTYISLDMVFIRADGTVHRVARATEPFSEEIVASKGPVLAVLELVAGAADKYGVEAGTRVEHPLFASGARR